APSRRQRPTRSALHAEGRPARRNRASAAQDREGRARRRGGAAASRQGTSSESWLSARLVFFGSRDTPVPDRQARAPAGWRAARVTLFKALEISNIVAVCHAYDGRRCVRR